MVNPVDKEVGQQIQRLRRSAGISTGQLADKVQLTGDEIEQYECGSERVSAYYLWRIAGFFCVPISTFFALSGIDDPEGLADVQALADILMDREAAKIVQNYQSLSADERRVLFNTVQRKRWPQ